MKIGFPLLRSVTLPKDQQAEERLRNQQALLQESQSLSHQGSFEWDIRLKRMTWSDELIASLAMSPDECEVTLERFLSHIHPEDQRRIEVPYRWLHDRCCVSHRRKNSKSRWNRANSDKCWQSTDG